MLPSFFVVGAQKSGTTSLHSYLAAHPSISLPDGKETKFFVDDERFVRGVEYYRAHWPSGTATGQLVGEVDPDYLYFDVALERMEQILDIGKTKFIFLFREPVSRAFSHYLMSYRRGIEPLSFEDAISEEPERIRKGYYEKLHYSYLARGHYYEQVVRFLERVDREKMLFILTDDLSVDPQGVMAEVFSFLEAKPCEGLEYGEKHWEAKSPRSMKLLKLVLSKGVHKSAFKLIFPFPEQRKKLREKIIRWNETDKLDTRLNEATRYRLKALYRDDNEKLAGLIGRDLSAWY